MKKAYLIACAAGVLLFAAACAKKDQGSAGQGAASVGRDAAAAAAETAEPAGRGWIEVKNADLKGHEVRRAGSAEKVDDITALRTSVALPAGIYDVTFGASVWKNVEVKAGETIALAAGSLVLKHAALAGHDVVEAATGAVQGRVSATTSNITLIPGKYEVRFGPLSWLVEIRGEETTTLDPGVVTVERAGVQGHRITDAAGKVVGEVSNIMSTIPLPPGEYVIEIGAEKIPFALKEGERRVFENK